MALFKSGARVVSLLPYHQTERLYESASAFFNIIMAASMNAFSVFSPLIPAAGMFGPFLAVSKADYDCIGGHSCVKDRILENFFMAKIFHARGIRIRLFGGRGTVRFRMYPNGPGELINGWTKAFAGGAAATSPLAMAMIVAWISGITALMINAAFFILNDTPHALPTWAAMYALYAGQIYWMLSRLGRFSLAAPLFFPLPFLAFLLIFCRSLVYQITGRSVLWRGRKIGQPRG